jgi:chromosome segregation ATPase
MTESKVTSVENELLAAREQIRTLEKEKADLNVQLDAEKRMNSESRLESKEQQNEITKLMEIIDRQKFDLDEARSGLRHYTNSPALDKKSLPADTNSLAHEQIEAEYMKEIALLEKELEGYQKKLAEKEQLISKTEKQLSSGKCAIDSILSLF